MSKNQGQTISAIDAAQRVDGGNPGRFVTFINDGSDSVFYQESNPEITMSGVAGTIRGQGGAELKAGEPITLEAIAWDVVCATGLTATMRVLPGSMASSINLEVSGLVVNTDIDKINGTTVNTNSGNKDGGTLVVNQATNGVNGVAFGLAADAPVVDGSFHAKFEYIGVQLDNLEALLTSANDSVPIANYYENNSGAGILPFYGANNISIGTSLETIKTNTDPLVAAGGGGYMRQDSTATIAKETGGNLDEIAKGGKANSVEPTTTFKVNATAIVDTTSVNSVPLAASSTPYITATVTARTGSANLNTKSTANTGGVHILTTADNLTTAWAPLEPGQDMPLPNNCNLTDFHLAVDVATEGVIITITV